MRGIVKSLATTMSTFIRGPVTRGYPSKHRELPERDRAFPLLLWDKDIDEPTLTIDERLIKIKGKKTY